MSNDALIQKMPVVQGAAGVADLLEFRSRSHGHKEALICGVERISYNVLYERATSVAHQLRTLGMQPHDRIALFLPNGINYVVAFFGSLLAGCTVVPVNPLLKADEIAHILHDSEASTLVCHQALLQEASTALSRTQHVHTVLTSPASGTTATISSSTTLKVAELCTTKEVADFQSHTVANPKTDLAVIVYTSGTTGKPKGAMLTHDNLLSVFPARLDLLEITEHDRCLGALPLCHIYGMTVIMIGTIAKGATLVIMPKFDAATAVRILEQEKISLLPAVPTMFQFMLTELAQNSYDLSYLRLCFCGGAPLSLETLNKIEQCMAVPVLEGYALTETACVATINPLRGQRKIGSVGTAIPGVQVAIKDDHGQTLAPGKDNVGEIAIAGPNVMAGYYGQAEATQDAIRDGWFMTGDLGYLDEDGYAYIVGRKKELIIRGGMNIYPREIEDAIARMPAVHEAAVIGIPDEMMGERVKAFVVRMADSVTEESVKEHCSQHLADYKIPRIVEFVDTLPRNPTGKVMKRLLK